MSIWKIKEFDGNIYRCKNKRTDRIREFAVDDPDIFDTKDAAMEVFIMFKIFNGTF